MNATIKNPSFNEINAVFKKLNVTSRNKNKNESIKSDELLIFKPKILQAVDYIREKKKAPRYECCLRAPEKNRYIKY